VKHNLLIHDFIDIPAPNGLDSRDREKDGFKTFLSEKLRNFLPAYKSTNVRISPPLTYNY
jgi:hypothetical protein